MKRFVLTSVILSMVFMSAHSVAAETAILKFATIQPSRASVVEKVYRKWIDRVMKDSEGTLKIDLFAGGTLGRNPKVQLKLLLDGMADIAWIVPDYTPGRFPDDQVFNMPFMLESENEGYHVAQRVFERGLLRGYENIKMLHIRLTGPYYIHSTYPIEKPEDLNGHKFRVAGKFHAGLLHQVGATTVGLPITACTESLSRGIIDGTLNDIQVLKLFRIADAAKYHIAVPLGTISMMIAMNKETWEGLPAKAQSAIDKNSGEALANLFLEEMGDDEHKIIDGLKKDPQHHFTYPDEANLKAWKQAFGPYIEQWKKDIPNGEKLINAFQEELERYRAEKRSKAHE